MKVKDITAAIEAFAPLNIQEGWDNSGLCIGAPEDEVHGVLVGFDCTAELIDEAIAAGCDMVVTHHPLIFKGLKRIQGGDPSRTPSSGPSRPGSRCMRPIPPRTR